MDVASSIASGLVGQPKLSSTDSTKTANFGLATGFAFDWLGIHLGTDAPGHRDADHPSATGYRQRP